MKKILSSETCRQTFGKQQVDLETKKPPSLPPRNIHILNPKNSPQIEKGTSSI